jgi:site-specific DNA-methyltransferase (adenine-specific)
LNNSKKKQKEKELVNKIFCGDVFHKLGKIPNDFVDLIITSPPYFQQRDYAEDEELEIGNEEYIINYLATLVEVFDECLRVCKRDGNIVFNLGDKYLKGDLQLIPYRFAMMVKDRFSPPLKLVNDITWVKSNPTPRQYDRRLVSATEPFFHFVMSPNYYYDRDAFQFEELEKKKITDKKGRSYEKQILSSALTPKEQLSALIAVGKARLDITEGKITDFRMKIRGVHKLAFGGQPGGRNNEIKNNGFTVIEMTGQKMKRDVIVTPVASAKNIDHPAIFPLEVIKELVLLLSPKDGIVIDPFCGSGTTCLAAKELDRRYIGIDLSEKYCEISRERLK